MFTLQIKTLNFLLNDVVYEKTYEKSSSPSARTWVYVDLYPPSPDPSWLLQHSVLDLDSQSVGQISVQGAVHLSQVCRDSQRVAASQDRQNTSLYILYPASNFHKTCQDFCL